MKLNHCLVFLVVLIATVIASGGRLGDGELLQRGWGLISCEYDGGDFDKGYHSLTESFECRSDGSVVCTREVETCEPCETSGNKTNESRTYMNTSNSVGEGNCPPGWTFLTTGCYKLTEGGNYQEAATNCRNAGGFLAEIDSQEEQTAIASFNQERVWLGATDIAKDGEWIWSHSGKEMIFTNWHNGEPNGDTRENCLDGWMDSTWNDIRCSANLPKALCELERFLEGHSEVEFPYTIPLTFSSWSDQSVNQVKSEASPGWDCRSNCKPLSLRGSKKSSSVTSGYC